MTRLEKKLWGEVYSLAFAKCKDLHFASKEAVIAADEAVRDFRTAQAKDENGDS
jgi:hypothetical protein